MGHCCLPVGEPDVRVDRKSFGREYRVIQIVEGKVYVRSVQGAVLIIFYPLYGVSQTYPCLPADILVPGYPARIAFKLERSCVARDVALFPGGENDPELCVMSGPGGNTSASRPISLI